MWTSVSPWYVAEELGSVPGGGDDQTPRVAMWSGKRAKWEMEQLHEQFDDFGIPHRWSTDHEKETGAWNGEWLREALKYLGEGVVKAE
jgi:hypothetical protein